MNMIVTVECLVVKPWNVFAELFDLSLVVDLRNALEPFQKNNNKK